MMWTSVEKKLQQALIACPVGSRPIEERVLVKNKKKRKGGNLLFFSVLTTNVLFWSSSYTIPILNHTLAKINNQSIRSSQVYVNPAPFSDQDVFSAEDAWRQKNWHEASQLFLKAAQSNHSVQVASWALRASILDNNSQNIQESKDLFNQNLDFLCKENKIYCDPHWYAQSWEDLPDQIENLEKSSSLSPDIKSTIEKYKSLSQVHAHYFTYLQMISVTSQEQILNLKRGKSGLDDIMSHMGDYQKWLNRKGNLTFQEKLESGLDYQKELNKVSNKKSEIIYQDKNNRTHVIKNIQTNAKNSSMRSVNEFGENFVDHYLGQGFTPLQVRNLWQEHQMLGDAFHEMKNEKIILAPQEEKIQDLRRLARTWLKDINTPQDLENYYQRWQKWGAAHPKEMSKAISSESFEMNLGGMIGSEVNWQERSKGMSGYDVPSPTMGMDDLNNFMFNNQMDLPEVQMQTPINLTLKEAQNHLQEVIEEVGLRRLSWPFQIKYSAQNIWHLANLLQESNVELQKQTGWSGSVLGLKGHVDLRLGSSSAQQMEGGTILSSFTNDSVSPLEKNKQDYVVLEVQMGKKSMGALAHEWTHAIDILSSYKTSNSDLAQLNLKNPLDFWALKKMENWEVGKDSQAWVELYQKMSNPNTNIQQIKEEQQQAWLQDTLVVLPMSRSVLSQSLADVRAGTFSKEKSFRLFKKMSKNDYFSSHEKEILKSLEDLSDLQELYHQKNPIQSAWMESSQQLGGKYWGAAPELLARSFATQAGPNTLISDLPDSHLAAKEFYPSQTEKSAEKIMWSDFFKNQKVWWKSYQSASMISSNVVSSNIASSDNQPHFSKESIVLEKIQSQRLKGDIKEGLNMKSGFKAK